MRRYLLVGIAVTLIAAAVYVFWPSQTGLQVLERAIEAHGGEAAIARCKVGQLKMQVTVDTLTQGMIVYTVDEAFQLPGRFKKVQRSANPRGELTETTLAKDGKLSEWRNGQKLGEGKAPEDIGGYLSILTGLVQIRDFARKGMAELQPLGAQSINGRPAIGLRIKRGVWFGDFYFDKETGRLAQVIHNRPDPEYNPELNMLAQSEKSFTNFQAVDGVTVPMTMTERLATLKRDADPNQPMPAEQKSSSRRYAEQKVLEVRLLDRLDDSVFQIEK